MLGEFLNVIVSSMNYKEGTNRPTPVKFISALNIIKQKINVKPKTSRTLGENPNVPRNYKLIMLWPRIRRVIVSTYSQSYSVWSHQAYTTHVNKGQGHKTETVLGEYDDVVRQ